MGLNIYTNIGGFPVVSKVVMDFYDHVLDSDVVGDFFDGIDMPKQIDHQTKFVSSLLGGPASYSDEQLKSIHSRLSIKSVHFDEILRLLDMALEENGLDQEVRNLVAREMELRRPFIVNS